MPRRTVGLPFLLLSIRAEDEAAEDEFAAMLRFGGLDERSLRRIRLDRQAITGLDLDDWSGIILGGGPYNFSDPPAHKSAAQRRAETELLALLERIVNRDFPFLGCCYGIGALGSYVGATVDRSNSEPIGSVPVSLTVTGRADPLFAQLPDVFDAFVGHKEAISVLPPEATRLASSPGCPVQAFRVGQNVYATQFHPELDVAGICNRIDIYKHYGYFDPASAEALKKSMHESHVVHPPAILRRFVRRFGREYGTTAG